MPLELVTWHGAILLAGDPGECSLDGAVLMNQNGFWTLGARHLDYLLGVGYARPEHLCCLAFEGDPQNFDQPGKAKWRIRPSHDLLDEGCAGGELRPSPLPPCL